MIAESKSEGQNASVEATARLGAILEEYAEIATILPVLAGLFMTSRFQLRGATALLTNLAIAAIVRQSILQMKKQARSHESKKVKVITSNIQNTENSEATKTTVDQTVDEELAISQDYTIIHSVPGRIRLRIPKLQRDALYAKRLQKLLEEEAIVLLVRINRAAASVVIQYEQAGLSELELGMRLLQILDQTEQIA